MEILNSSCWTCASIILSFTSYLLGQNKFVWSKKLLPFNIKILNPMQEYLPIMESFVCILWIFV